MAALRDYVEVHRLFKHSLKCHRCGHSKIVRTSTHPSHWFAGLGFAVSARHTELCKRLLVAPDVIRMIMVLAMIRQPRHTEHSEKNTF